MKFRRLLTMILPAVALVLMTFGCDGKKASTQNDATANNDTPTPRRVETTTDKPAQQTRHDDGNEPIEEPIGELAEEPTAPERIAPRTNIEFASGRSPFPEEGEQITTPISATLLSQADQFLEDIDPEDIPDVVPWTEAGQYLGHEITVEGRIVNIGSAGKVSFLNYDPNWRGKFYLVIFEDLAETLDGSVDEVFLNKLIRVTGEVEEHRGRPQIKILSMDQVEFVDEEDAEEGDDEGGDE